MSGDALQAIATGREASMFAADLAAAAPAIRAAVEGRRILAIGAAGSIGSNTVMTLAGFAPASLHLVDQNENGLAELIRQFRSGCEEYAVPDLRALPLDYGAAAMRHFIRAAGPYDLVLNFAAIKHVRSEKDAFSILQMLDTNIVKQARVMRWLRESAPEAAYFSVSTDKAANPSSFMGATKRLMEHVMFSRGLAFSHDGPVRSARFANVAFSNGSLLQAFEHRFARGEPIACPGDIRRYFVSLEESGHICALAALAMPDRHIAIPRLDPASQLVPLIGIAEAFIRARGFEPLRYDDEIAARRAAPADIAARRWPLIVTAGDTAGEKPYEEFVGETERVVRTGHAALDAIPYDPADPSALAALLDELERIVVGEGDGVGAPEIDKDRVKGLIAAVEPAFLSTHRASTLGLDQRA